MTEFTVDSAFITKELAKGKFTDEMLADMRSPIGTDLRTDPWAGKEYATRMAILYFAEGIGDDKPLWTDLQYAAITQAMSTSRPSPNKRVPRSLYSA
ncbi:hypothetical protein IQ288_20420 [Burkholderia sp. R-69980]|nr:hypothetical protein [Burkholderia sp. R-69980]